MTKLSDVIVCTFHVVAVKADAGRLAPIAQTVPAEVPVKEPAVNLAVATVQTQISVDAVDCTGNGNAGFCTQVCGLVIVKLSNFAKNPLGTVNTTFWPISTSLAVVKVVLNVAAVVNTCASKSAAPAEGTDMPTPVVI